MAFENFLLTGKGIELDREAKTVRFHMVSVCDPGDAVVICFQYDSEEPLEGEPVAEIEPPQEDIAEPEPEPTPPDEPGELVEGDNTE